MLFLDFGKVWSLSNPLPTPSTPLFVCPMIPAISRLQSGWRQQLSIIAGRVGWPVGSRVGGHRGRIEMWLHLWLGCCLVSRCTIPVCSGNTDRLHTSRFLNHLCLHLKSPLEIVSYKEYYRCKLKKGNKFHKGTHLHPESPHHCHPVHFSASCSWFWVAWSAGGWSCPALWYPAQLLGCWSDWPSHLPSPLEDTWWEERQKRRRRSRHLFCWISSLWTSVWVHRKLSATR